MSTGAATVAAAECRQRGWARGRGSVRSCSHHCWPCAAAAAYRIGAVTSCNEADTTPVMPPPGCSFPSLWLIMNLRPAWLHLMPALFCISACYLIFRNSRVNGELRKKARELLRCTHCRWLGGRRPAVIRVQAIAMLPGGRSARPRALPCPIARPGHRIRLASFIQVSFYI